MKTKLEKKLLNFAEKSTEIIEKNNWQYYYESDGLKFFNSHLVNWYEKNFNTWVKFVVKYLPSVKTNLYKESIDLNYDYDLDYLKNLTKNNSVTCFFSGGEDSVYMLKKANENGIKFDRVLSAIFGDNIDHPVNQEVKYNAIPFLESNPDCHYKILSHSLDFLEYRYKDPLYFFKVPDFNNSMPVFRRTYDQIAQDLNSDVCLLGPDKPQLLTFYGKWYCVLQDCAVMDFAPLMPKIEFLNRNEKNIKSLLKESIIFKNYIMDNNLYESSSICFYKMLSNTDASAKIGRPRLSNSLKQFKKANNELIWPHKEQSAIQYAVENQRFNLLKNYFAAKKNLISINSDNKNPYDILKMNNKFGWFIDLDTLDIYSQEEFIPDGFPADMKIITKSC